MEKRFVLERDSQVGRGRRTQLLEGDVGSDGAVVASSLPSVYVPSHTALHRQE